MKRSISDRVALFILLKIKALENGAGPVFPALFLSKGFMKNTIKILLDLTEEQFKQAGAITFNDIQKDILLARKAFENVKGLLAAQFPDQDAIEAAEMGCGIQFGLAIAQILANASTEAKATSIIQA